MASHHKIDTDVHDISTPKLDGVNNASTVKLHPVKPYKSPECTEESHSSHLLGESNASSEKSEIPDNASTVKLHPVKPYKSPECTEESHSPHLSGESNASSEKIEVPINDTTSSILELGCQVKYRNLQALHNRAANILDRAMERMGGKKIPADFISMDYVPWSEEEILNLRSEVYANNEILDRLRKKVSKQELDLIRKFSTKKEISSLEYDEYLILKKTVVPDKAAYDKLRLTCRSHWNQLRQSAAEKRLYIAEQKRLMELCKEIPTKDFMIGELNGLSKVKDSMIDGLNCSLKAKDSMIDDQSCSLIAKDSMIEDLNCTLKAKGEEVERLHKSIQEKERACKQAVEEAVTAERERCLSKTAAAHIESIEASISAEKTENNILRRQLSEARVEISQLKDTEKINEKRAKILDDQAFELHNHGIKVLKEAEKKRAAEQAAKYSSKSTQTDVLPPHIDLTAADYSSKSSQTDDLLPSTYLTATIESNAPEGLVDIQMNGGHKKKNRRVLTKTKRARLEAENRMATKVAFTSPATLESESTSVEEGCVQALDGFAAQNEVLHEVATQNEVFDVVATHSGSNTVHPTLPVTVAIVTTAPLTASTPWMPTLLAIFCLGVLPFTLDWLCSSSFRNPFQLSLDVTPMLPIREWPLGWISSSSYYRTLEALSALRSLGRQFTFGCNTRDGLSATYSLEGLSVFSLHVWEGILALHPLAWLSATCQHTWTDIWDFVSLEWGSLCGVGGEGGFRLPG
jgi:hypothetical protein